MPPPDFDAKSFKAQDSLGYLIGNLRRALLDELDKAFAPHDVTAPQAIVMFQVAGGVAEHAAEFCRNLRYDPGAMTRLLDRLEAKGLVRRMRNPHNRRNVRIELTPAGRTVLPHLGNAAFDVFDIFLRGFNKTEARQLFGFLKRMLANAP